MGHRLTWLDVFTSVPFAGNGLAVVHDADDLDDATMLAFARETRLSETTFVQRPTADGADYRNRIFYPNGELPFAGHPSLGTAAAVARMRGERTAEYVQQTVAGLQSIGVELAGDKASTTMLQEPAVFGEEVDPTAALGAAGLAAEDAAPGLTPQVVSTGLSHLLVPVRDLSVLARARPALEAVAAITEQTGTVVLYLAACDAAAGSAQARGFFAGYRGLEEDPATGSAVGPLCAYLAERTGVERVTVAQGVEIGRASRMDAAIEGDRVRVSGEVVFVSDGELLI